MMGKFGEYSLRNQILIQNQMPKATRVNNMNGWNYRKRYIVKGSQSIKIIAPVFDKTITTDASGNIVEKTSDFVTGYTVNSVFDISQTDGELLKEWIADNTLTEHCDIVETALKDILSGYVFNEGNIEIDGILDTHQRTITLKSGINEKSKIAVLINQIAAALVIGRNRDNFQGLRVEQLSNIVTVEISAAANIVAGKLGLENFNLVEPDISKISDEDLHKFSNNLGVIRSISQIMIRGIENALSADATKKELETIKLNDLATNVETTVSDKVTRTTAKSRTKAVAEMGD